MRTSGCPTRETAPRQARSHCPPEAIYRAALFREVRDAAATAGIVRAVATAGAIDGVFTQPRPTADTKKNPSTARRHLAEPSAGSGAVLSPRGARAAQGLPLPCAAAGIASADVRSLRDRDGRSSSGADRGEKDVTCVGALSASRSRGDFGGRAKASERFENPRRAHAGADAHRHHAVLLPAAA